MSSARQRRPRKLRAAAATISPLSVAFENASAPPQADSCDDQDPPAGCSKFDLPLILGAYITCYRVERSESQVGFAKKIGMDPSQFAKIERGEHIAGIVTLARIADGLDMPLCEMLQEISRDHIRNQHEIS